MKDKEKQIEEMAKLTCHSQNSCYKGDCIGGEFCAVRESCEKLYNAGYRKLSEDSYDQGSKETAEKFYDYKVVRVFAGVYDSYRRDSNLDALEKLLNDGYIIERVDSIDNASPNCKYTMNDYILFKPINKEDKNVSPDSIKTV